MSAAARRLLIVPLAFAALVALLACESDDPITPTGEQVTVRGETLRYDPATVTILAGQTVTWTWAANDHSVTSMGTMVNDCTPDGEFNSTVLDAGDVFTRTFPTPGTYVYGCTEPGHCAGQESGTVVVQ